MCSMGNSKRRYSIFWEAAKTNAHSLSRKTSSTKGPQNTCRLTSAKYESSVKITKYIRKQPVIVAVSKGERRERKEKKGKGKRKRVI